MSRRTFDETGYPCESAPAKAGAVDEDAWVYTQAEGFVVCANGCTHCGRQRKAITISWGQIKRA